MINSTLHNLRPHHHIHPAEQKSLNISCNVENFITEKYKSRYLGIARIRFGCQHLSKYKYYSFIITSKLHKKYVAEEKENIFYLFNDGVFLFTRNSFEDRIKSFLQHRKIFMLVTFHRSSNARTYFEEYSVLVYDLKNRKVKLMIERQTQRREDSRYHFLSVK